LTENESAKDDETLSARLLEKFKGAEITEQTLEAIIIEILTFTANRVPELAKLLHDNPADANKRIDRISF
jgi:hypothetical protein